MRTILLLIILLSLAAACAAADATPDSAPAPAGDTAAPVRPEHIIIAVIDGPRWSETWGEPTRQYIPERVKLLPQAVWFSDFANDGPTYTNAGHTALLTGVYQEINNSGKELPKNPTLIQRWLKASGAPATGAPATSAWVITTKDKLSILADCQDPAWHGQYLCSTDCGVGGKGTGAGYREDPETFAHLMATLRDQHPRIVLSNFKQPDAAGHAKDWAGYLQGIRDTDAMIGQLWQFLSTDPAYAGKTLLLVTNDHGRHLDGIATGYVDHGDTCAGCRKIELMGLGVGIKGGTVVDRHCGQIDVAVTVAALLGVELPSAGQQIPELMGKP